MILSLIALAASTITATPIASPTPTTTSEIQKIREVVQEKVQEQLKQIINPSTTKMGLIGKVIQIDSSQITIEYQNNTSVLQIDSSTVYVDLNRNKSSAANVKIGQDILAMGINDSSTDTFQTKRVVFINLDTVSLNRTVVIGKIVDISKTSPIFTLIPSKNKNNLYQIKTDKNTGYMDSNQQKLAAADLKSGQRIIVVLVPDPKISKTYTALKIMDLDYTPNPPAGGSPTPTPKTP
jgi:hypothetical protein